MRYEITVKGTLDSGWSAWLNGMAIAVETLGQEHPLTVLTGEIGDQAALRGMLNRLWDLNLTLISVRRTEADKEEHQ